MLCFVDSWYISDCNAWYHISQIFVNLPWDIAFWKLFRWWRPRPPLDAVTQGAPRENVCGECRNYCYATDYWSLCSVIQNNFDCCQTSRRGEDAGCQYSSLFTDSDWLLSTMCLPATGCCCRCSTAGGLFHALNHQKSLNAAPRRQIWQAVKRRSLHTSLCHEPETRGHEPACLKHRRAGGANIWTISIDGRTSVNRQPRIGMFEVMFFYISFHGLNHSSVYNIEQYQ